ncbi:MAG: ATPase domain-containing protein, partial [Thermosphaera sp.]
MVERIKTGIPGFDEILNGGIPKRNVVLLSGGPGTGKSIFSAQFL